MQDGHIAAAALDVFEIEPLPEDSPLRAAPNLILTPHLGASTAEAQESVGIEIAQSIRAALLEGTIRNAVNMPNLDAKTLSVIGPHLRFGEKLGRFLSQVAPRRVDELKINYSGKVNELDTGPITRAVLKGFLQSAGGADINEVNAPAFAESLGLKVTETRLSAAGDYTDLKPFRSVAHFSARRRELSASTAARLKRDRMASFLFWKIPIARESSVVLAHCSANTTSTSPLCR